MALDFSNNGEEKKIYLDAKEAIGALRPYGTSSQASKLNSFQREYFDSLEKPIQTKIETLAASLHKNQELLTAITFEIQEGNTLNAEIMMMQIVEENKRITKQDTKMEFHEAINELVHILSVSNFGDQIDTTKNHVEQVLDTSEHQHESVAA